MEFTVIIPARYHSSRFPGKPLVPLDGVPMIRRVHDAAAASGAARVAVATDDRRIAETCRDFGAEVIMTRSEHASGTHRLAEAAHRMGLADDTVVVNLQGDEPLLPPLLLAEAAETLADPDVAEMGTLATPLAEAAQAFDPNVVKVVCDRLGNALYFSRAAIPWDRDGYAQGASAAATGALRHIGVYAYRADFLRRYPSLEEAPMERTESLEQLRALWHGFRIRVRQAAVLPGPGVDVPEDVARVEAALRAGPAS